MLGLIVVCPPSGGLDPAHLLDAFLGVPLLARCVGGALPADQAVAAVVVVPADLVERAQETLARFSLDEVERVVAGGPDRAGMVRTGLEALPADVDPIIIVDGSRALIPLGLTDRVIAAAHHTGVAAPAVALVDEIVAVQDTVSAVESGRLRVLQGPQVLARQTLSTVLASSDHGSEAAAAAALGLAVTLVDGDVDNLVLRNEADEGRALEVFARRALDYAFLFPRDLLPEDPVAGDPRTAEG